METIKIKLKNKNIIVLANKVNFFRKGFGLMFRTRHTKNLFFSFSRKSRPTITSFFVFFPFLAVWLDKNYRVVEVVKVPPFTFSLRPSHQIYFLLEIPINHTNRKLISFLVGK